MSTATYLLNQFQYSLEKDTVTICGSFTVDGYGEVATYQGGGVTSVASTGTGAYDIQLDDGWDHFFSLTAQPVKVTASTIATVQLVNVPADLQADIKNKVPLSVLTLNYAGAAADPSTTESIYFVIKVRRSSYGPFDTSTTV